MKCDVWVLEFLYIGQRVAKAGLYDIDVAENELEFLQHEFQQCIVCCDIQGATYSCDINTHQLGPQMQPWFQICLSSRSTSSLYLDSISLSPSSSSSSSSSSAWIRIAHHSKNNDSIILLQSVEFFLAVTKEGTHKKKWKCKFGRFAEVLTALFGFCLVVFLTCGSEEWVVIQLRYFGIQCLVYG